MNHNEVPILVCSHTAIEAFEGLWEISDCTAMEAHAPFQICQVYPFMWRGSDIPGMEPSVASPFTQQQITIFKLGQTSAYEKSLGVYHIRRHRIHMPEWRLWTDALKVVAIGRLQLHTLAFACSCLRHAVNDANIQGMKVIHLAFLYLRE